MGLSDVTLPSNRKFGLLFSGIFLILGMYLFYRGASDILVFLSCTFSLITLVISLIFPGVLFPFNRLWMRFGLILGRIVSPIILATIFFGLISPVGIFLRLFGRDELVLKVAKKVTYWRSRKDSKISRESFKNQF